MISEELARIFRHDEEWEELKLRHAQEGPANDGHEAVERAELKLRHAQEDAEQKSRPLDEQVEQEYHENIQDSLRAIREGSECYPEEDLREMIEEYRRGLYKFYQDMFAESTT